MRYDVTLYGDGASTCGAIESVEAETPALAVTLAERMKPGMRAASVSQNIAVIGRCSLCKGVLLDTDRVRQRKGKPRCESCL